MKCPECKCQMEIKYQPSDKEMLGFYYLATCNCGYEEKISPAKFSSPAHMCFHKGSVFC
ncbi:MAG: hypothetical protein U5L76_04715 [Patescibacteria group bacterium]|nr:hypothetical protein [Patescibacteria group bacterium]